MVNNLPLSGRNTSQRSILSPNPDLQALALFFGLLVAILTIWELGVKFQIFSPVMPSASKTIVDFWGWISDPFFDNG